MSNAAYNFPVRLEPAYIRSGKPIPRRQAVVRMDTNEPIATVGKGFKLLTHEKALMLAKDFIHQLGEPKRKIYLADAGAIMIAEYTFEDRSLALQVGNTIGLRVFIKNAYNGTSKLIVRVGALVLRCLNGMTVPRDIFSVAVRHIGENMLERVSFPNPERVLNVFNQEGKKWKRYSEIELIESDYSAYIEQAIKENIIQQNVTNAPCEGHTVWDMYNQMTYCITHMSKANPIGKILRLDRVGNWFNDRFHV